MKRIAKPIITTDLCSYGCGEVAKFINGSNKLMCKKSHSSCSANKKKNSNGVSNCGRDYAKDYQNLPQSTKDRMNWAKGKFTGTVFAYNGKGNHKGVLIEERGHKCEECNLTHWQGNLIPLELEHTDGNNKNNNKENLKLLCCNCHALTPTWRGRNINTGVIKVSDSDLLTTYEKCSNIRQTLLEVGLSAKGGNYERLKKLIGTVEKQVYSVDLKSTGASHGGSTPPSPTSRTKYY